MNSLFSYFGKTKARKRIEAESNFRWIEQEKLKNLEKRPHFKQFHKVVQRLARKFKTDLILRHHIWERLI
jgi:hypothetical protein